MTTSKRVRKGTLGSSKRAGNSIFKLKVANHYAKRGFSVRSNVSNKYGNFDLIATKKHGKMKESQLTLLIECKNYGNDRVPFGAFVRFVRKFVRYFDHYESREGGNWNGVFVYLGRLDRQIRPFWKSIPDKDWIRLQKFKQ